MPTESDELASLCAQAHAALARAGRALHDDVGPQIAGAGLLLSLIQSDHPGAAPAVQAVITALDQAMESVRALSQQLNASPVDRLGLRHALARFAENDSRVTVRYSATATVSRETASTLYAAAAVAIRVALQANATVVRVRATGSSRVNIRVTDDGRVAGRKRKLAVARKLAEAAGLVVTVTTVKSTIVSISHAVRRPTGR